MRRPRLTRVSDGKPLRRLFIDSKQHLVIERVVIIVVDHATPPFMLIDEAITAKNEEGVKLVSPYNRFIVTYRKFE
jgi:hypothetical protein